MNVSRSAVLGDGLQVELFTCAARKRHQTNLDTTTLHQVRKRASAGLGPLQARAGIALLVAVLVHAIRAVEHQINLIGALHVFEELYSSTASVVRRRLR